MEGEEGEDGKEESAKYPWLNTFLKRFRKHNRRVRRGIRRLVKSQVHKYEKFQKPIVKHTFGKQTIKNNIINCRLSTGW